VPAGWRVGRAGIQRQGRSTHNTTCQDRNGPSGLKVRVKGHERHVEILSIAGGGSPQAIELKAH